MSNNDHTISANDDPTIVAQRRLYKGMMDFTMVWGLPVGGAIAMLIALLLMQSGLFVSFFAAFLTWVGLRIFSKSFLVH